MQNHTDYGDKGVVNTVCEYFSHKHKLLEYFDIPRYWVDPGIGFGKTPGQSIELLRNTAKFCGRNHGVLMGASRKSWIGKTFDVPVEDRMGGSLAAALHSAQEGAEILRVHDVQETTQALATQQLLKTSTASKNRLILEDIETRTRIGIHAEEKVAEQGIRISLQMEGDFAGVIGSDDLAEGVDYVHIIEEVRHYCGQHRGNTLEHLAHHLAEHLKAKFRAEAIDLTLDKPRYTGKLELSAIRFHVRR
jgi:FolB domain-containing protein